MDILDALIIILIIVCAMGGMRRGLIKQSVLLVGLVVAIVVSFYLRVPVSTFMYKNLPFINFGGAFQGISVLNILLYELIAFLLVFSVIYLILRVLLKISGLIEKLLKATIILGFFSKIGGAIVGAIEGYLIIFIMLFIFNQPFIKISGVENSKLSPWILENTPFMSGAIENTKKVIEEVSVLSDKYRDDKITFNEEAITLFIKYDIITNENVELLKEKGKL